MRPADLHARQRAALFHQSPPASHFVEAREDGRAGDLKRQERGRELIAQGKMGCIVLAGGQGSRLGIPGPKGCVPVLENPQKTLFQLVCERALARSKEAGRELPFAIMTSPLNHAETKRYLEKNHLFGLSSIRLFEQGMLPLLDDRGNWLMDKDENVVEAPDGNGGLFHALAKAGILDEWRRAGVEMINIVLIDNPLADPFDPELAAFHFEHKTDVTIKAIERKGLDEKVGAIAKTDNHVRVIEYSELSEKQKEFPLANISLLCFNTDFVQRVVNDPMMELPWHFARKEITFQPGSSQMAMMVWKCETFIFDLLQFTEKTKILLYPRSVCFAPLKKPEDLESVRAALLKEK
jgi:UDP-N-acetylglucosamine/UDP-N-acetylgalactosamine diphosphorylase